MGMFDLIGFNCPSCGGDVYVQTKGGLCELKTFGERGVPLDIAGSVLHDDVTCPHCQTTSVIQTNQTRIEMHLAKKEDDEESDG